MKPINIIVLLTFFISCSSTTQISVKDHQVDIYADDQLIGKGNARYTDTKVVFSKTHITLKKDGCEENKHIIKRNEETDWLAFTGGLITLIPFLWVKKYKPIHEYDFKCTLKK